MAFWFNILRLLRHRPTAITAAGVSLALAAAAFSVIPTSYTSHATVVLTSSPTNQASVAGDPNATPRINPLLNFNEGLNTALAILVQALNTPDTLDQIQNGDPKTTIKITDIGDASFLGNKGPFLFLTGQSTRSAQDAQDIVTRAAQRGRDELLTRQRSLNAPESQLITTLFVVQPTEPQASSATRWQGAVAGLLLGLVLTIGSAYVVSARRARKLAPAGDAMLAEADAAMGPGPGAQAMAFPARQAGPPPGWPAMPMQMPPMPRPPFRAGEPAAQAAVNGHNGVRPHHSPSPDQRSAQQTGSPTSEAPSAAPAPVAPATVSAGQNTPGETEAAPSSDEAPPTERLPTSAPARPVKRRPVPRPRSKPGSPQATAGSVESATQVLTVAEPPVLVTSAPSVPEPEVKASAAGSATGDSTKDEAPRPSPTPARRPLLRRVADLDNDAADVPGRTG